MAFARDLNSFGAVYVALGLDLDGMPCVDVDLEEGCVLNTSVGTSCVIGEVVVEGGLVDTGSADKA